MLMKSSRIFILDHMAIAANVLKTSSAIVFVGNFRSRILARYIERCIADQKDTRTISLRPISEHNNFERHDIVTHTHNISLELSFPIHVPSLTRLVSYHPLPHAHADFNRDVDACVLRWLIFSFFLSSFLLLLRLASKFYWASTCIPLYCFSLQIDINGLFFLQSQVNLLKWSIQLPQIFKRWQQ
jgi:hypothetical protein